MIFFFAQKPRTHRFHTSWLIRTHNPAAMRAEKAAEATNTAAQAAMEAAQESDDSYVYK
jgi:hypothetical protein